MAIRLSKSAAGRGINLAQRLTTILAISFLGRNGCSCPIIGISVRTAWVRSSGVKRRLVRVAVLSNAHLHPFSNLRKREDDAYS
jgi:hypothetical protein